MTTLSEIIKQVQKFKSDTSLRMFSMAYGPVVLKTIDGSGSIEVTDQDNAIFSFDKYGRIHPKGSCLLYPETKESWEVYLKRITDEYYDSLIRIGDVCLVKSDENDEWGLAIYEGKFDGKYRAKRGIETESFLYCISYKENSSYLGRSMFPDWMLTEEDEINT